MAIHQNCESKFSYDYNSLYFIYKKEKISGTIAEKKKKIDPKIEQVTLWVGVKVEGASTASWDSWSRDQACHSVRTSIWSSDKVSVECVTELPIFRVRETCHPQQTIKTEPSTWNLWNF